MPPGPRFLFALLPSFITPAAIAYSFLTLFNAYLGGLIPKWFVLLATCLARPILSILQRYYTRSVDCKAAAAHNAFIIPHVQEKPLKLAGLSLMKMLVDDFKAGYPGNQFRKWSLEYGYTYQLRFPSENRIVTFDPEHIKAILATQFDTFDKGPVFYKQSQSLLGTGVFNSDGEMWKFHRSMTRPFFTRDRISDFDVFEAHSAHALKLAKARLEEGHAIDFQDLALRFTLDSATTFLFGHNVDSLSAGPPYSPTSGMQNSRQFLEHPSNTFVDAFVKAQTQTALRLRVGPIWPLAEFWEDKVEKSRKVMDQYTLPFLKKALEETEKKNGVDEDEEPETLLSHLARHTQDDKIIQDELTNLLVAGRDTAGCTLTFAIYMLAEHPKIATRLRQEVIEVVGATGRPTYDNLRDMKYMRAFINEVLRLYAPVPFNSRTSHKPAVWTSKGLGSKPYYIPANTKVLYSVMYLHRRKDLWGPDALEFDPDRFLDERLHKHLTPNPFIFCPFNAGPRICLGQQFAYQETSYFLVRLLQQFGNFRLDPGAQPAWSKPPADWAHQGDERAAKEKITPAFHLTLYVKGGLWGRMDEVY
ncbi:cytochrome P450 monooxygenase pc-3 [Agrocybe pediades]|nr:cytochrome P450 monooxygenase pc-3 [Agrocybe pediades]